MVDGVLDGEEARELLALLKALVGQDENATLGEVFHPSSLPLNQPPPKVIFNGKMFIFTGTFGYGTRKDCHKLTESLGGVCIQSVRKDTDYLVIGQYVTETWQHESFGRKIEQAVEHQTRGLKVQIISEKHWLESCQNGGMGDAVEESPEIEQIIYKWQCIPTLNLFTPLELVAEAYQQIADCDKRDKLEILEPNSCRVLDIDADIPKKTSEGFIRI